MKTDAITFEVNMTNPSQDIIKKQFQRQLTVPQLIWQYVFEKKSFTFVLRRNVFLLNVLIIELTDVLLIVNFVKCYQAAIIMNK